MRALVTQKARMRARGDHAAIDVLHMHDPVTFDAERAHAHPLQLFSSHRFDRISPDLVDLHRHLLLC